MQCRASNTENRQVSVEVTKEGKRTCSQKTEDNVLVWLFSVFMDNVDLPLTSSLLSVIKK